MSPLFGKREDHSGQVAAADAELARLTALSPAALAVEMMPAFGPDGPRGSGGINAVQVAQWLFRSGAQPGLKPLLAPVQKAVQTLEQAGLVEQRTSGIGTGTVTAKATPLGTQALTENNVAQHLAAPSP